MVTPERIELSITPWEGVVLAAWPRGHIEQMAVLPFHCITIYSSATVYILTYSDITVKKF